MKYFFLFLFVAFLILRPALAQQDTEVSDYAKDVAEGQQEVNNDSQAQEAQHEESLAEEPKAGNTETQEVSMQETVAPQEAIESSADLEPVGVGETITPEPQPEDEGPISPPQTP